MGHSIQLSSYSRECFHEELHKEDMLSVTFQVGDREFGGAGNLDIDFWVRRPLSCPPHHTTQPGVVLTYIVGGWGN